MIILVKPDIKTKNEEEPSWTCEKGRTGQDEDQRSHQSKLTVVLELAQQRFVFGDPCVGRKNVGQTFGIFDVKASSIRIPADDVRKVESLCIV